MSNPNQETVTITPHNLPLHCSGPRNETWNGHPRVFLPMVEEYSGGSEAGADEPVQCGLGRGQAELI